jgi:hypothetical protein
VAGSPALQSTITDSHSFAKMHFSSAQAGASLGGLGAHT